MGALGWLILLAIVAVVVYLLWVNLMGSQLKSANGGRVMRDGTYLGMGEYIADDNLHMVMGWTGNMCITRGTRANPGENVWCLSNGWNAPKPSEKNFIAVYKDAKLIVSAVQPDGSLRTIYASSFPAGTQAIGLSPSGPVPA